VNLRSDIVMAVVHKTETDTWWAQVEGLTAWHEDATAEGATARCAAELAKRMRKNHRDKQFAREREQHRAVEHRVGELVEASDPFLLDAVERARQAAASGVEPDVRYMPPQAVGKREWLRRQDAQDPLD